MMYPGLALHFEEAVDYLENVWRKNRGEEHLTRTLEKKEKGPGLTCPVCFL